MPDREAFCCNLLPSEVGATLIARLWLVDPCECQRAGTGVAWLDFGVGGPPQTLDRPGDLHLGAWVRQWAPTGRSGPVFVHTSCVLNATPSGAGGALGWTAAMAIQVVRFQ